MRQALTKTRIVVVALGLAIAPGIGTAQPQKKGKPAKAKATPEKKAAPKKAPPKATPPKAPTKKAPVAAPAVPAAPPTPSPAAPQLLKTIFFPVQGDKSIPSLTGEIDKALRALQQPIQSSSLALDELMLAVGCSNRSVGCLQKIGQMVQAPALLFADAKKEGGKVVLRLRWFHVQSGSDAGIVEALMPKSPDKRQPVLLALLRKLYKLPDPAKPPEPGKLLIQCAQPYVEILINGQPRGIAPLFLKNLPADTYMVAAQRKGFEVWQRRITVKGGTLITVNVQLKRAARTTKRKKGFFGSIQPQTWIIAGLGVASLGVSIGFGAHLSSQQNEFDRLEGNTSAEIARMRQLSDNGDRDAVVANVMVGVGMGLLVTAGVLAYLDYLRERRTADEHIGSDATQKKDEDGSSISTRFGISPAGVAFGMDF
jgi:hypothetical protein